LKRLLFNRLIRWIASWAFCLIILASPALGQKSHGLDLKAADAIHEVIEKSYKVNKNGSYTLTVHVRTKVLTYKGKKEHADFKYPYNSAYQSVKVLDAHTLTLEGKVIPVEPKEMHDINDPEDARATIYSYERLKVVNFPSVEPGSTVEIKFELHSKRGFWAMECFRLSDPVKQKIVTVTLPDTSILRIKPPYIRLENTKRQEGENVVYRWEARNVPKRIYEPMLPPIENRKTCLFLSTFKSWKEVAGFFGKILKEPPLYEDVKGFKGETPDHLYVNFMKHFTIYPIDFFHTALTLQAPETTLKKGYGSPMDLALLFYGILKKKGFVPRFLVMNSGGVMLGEFKEMPLPFLFDDAIVRCKGSDYAFYAKDLPPGFTGLEGRQLVLDLTTGRLAPSIQRYENRSIAHLSLAPTSSFDLEGVFSMRSEGMQAVSVRNWLKYKTREEWRIAASQILHGIDPIARPEGKITKQGLNTLTIPVVLAGKFLIPRPFPNNGNLSFVTIKKPDLPGGLETCLETRKGPLMVGRDFTGIFEQKIALPKGLHVLHHPPSRSGSLKVMDFELGVHIRKNELIFGRRVHLKRGILYPGTAAYFRFVKAINALYRPANRLIVLERMR